MVVAGGGGRGGALECVIKITLGEKKSCVYCYMPKKNESVGRDFFFF